MRRLSLACVILILGICCTAPLCGQTSHGKKVVFKKHKLDADFRSEGAAVADLNKDGKLDIVAGFVWFAAPDWKMHKLTEKDAVTVDPRGYSHSFCTFADDINGDGWQDVLVVDFPGTPTWVFENPKEPGKEWTKRSATPVTNNESPAYLDLDGDGKRELILAFNPDAKNTDGPEKQMGFARPAQDRNAEWLLTAVSAKNAPGCNRYSHGLGVGDVNKDGKNDILCADGWWECPANGANAGGEWKYRAAPWGGQASNIHVFDYDGDGDNDVLTSSPHGFGLWWHEQTAANEWKKHEIDMTFSQIHSICHADINGDGLPDIVTGKRFWAHAPGADGKGGDPGVNDPAVFIWFELKRENGRPNWIAHQFDHDSGVGTQFEVADVNGDGLLDVISSNKKGTQWFEQTRE